MTDLANTLSPSEVKSLFGYDAETGLFERRFRSSSNSPAGPLKGSTHSRGYLTVRVAGKSYYLHRIAWAIHYGCWPDRVVDHINGDKQDNRISNLRLATHQQNQCNRRAYANSKTGVKGVSFKDGKFVAFIRVNRRAIYLGSRETIEEAQKLYKEAAVKYQGDFANI